MKGMKISAILALLVATGVMMPVGIAVAESSTADSVVVQNLMKTQLENAIKRAEDAINTLKTTEQTEERDAHIEYLTKKIGEARLLLIGTNEDAMKEMAQVLNEAVSGTIAWLGINSAAVADPTESEPDVAVQRPLAVQASYNVAQVAQVAQAAQAQAEEKKEETPEQHKEVAKTETQEKVQVAAKEEEVEVPVAGSPWNPLTIAISVGTIAAAAGAGALTIARGVKHA